MKELILYSTPGCHLCERALDEVELCIADEKLSVNEVDIATDPELLREYGTSIPVLFYPAADKRLYWPFDRLQVMELLMK